MGVAVVSMMTIQGDSDELVAKLREKVEPVAAKKASEYGGVSTTVAPAPAFKAYEVLMHRTPD